MSARTVLLLLVIAACLCAWAYIGSARRGLLPKHRVRCMRARIHLRLRAGRGHATLAELWLRWGRFAVYRRSRRVRSSLTRRQRLRHPESHSILIGFAQLRHRLRVSLEEHVLVVAPPRTGKTGWLARVILRYPGPVVSTTTKHDVFELTSGIRSRRGPVHVFNPQNIGGVASTFRWNPLEGCENPSTAIRRADAITQAVSLEGTEDASFWTAKASSWMRGMFHAGALAGTDMRTVVRWALGDASEAEAILAGNDAGQWAAELAEMHSDAQKTAQTVRMVLSRALAFMTDPALASSVLPGGAHRFSIPDFVRDSGTLYMIADSAAAEAPLAPLFAALASEIHWAAIGLGQASPGGRLDPPLLLALDEVTQICPVPLPVWLADSGGKGVQVIAVAHGDAQLESRWKQHGRRIIQDCSGVKLLLPGITDTGTLEAASKLCGLAAYREHGQEHLTRHPVMEPDMIRSLPASRCLVIRSAMAPVVATLPMAWRDRQYRKARKRGESIAVLPAVPAAAEVAPLIAPVKSGRNGHGRLADVLPGPWEAPERPGWSQ